MNKSLICYTLSLCLVKALCVEIPDAMIDETTATCMKEVGVDKQALLKTIDENMLIVNKDEDTVKMLECQIGKRHFYDASGNFDKDNTIKSLAEGLVAFDKDEGERQALAIRIFDECTNSTIENQVDRLIEFHNCAMPIILQH
ncbi:hypothetical protein PPYR_13469 [Photinus pyralis]|uniref:Uncharacterized protein n=1 Tax=Photinus pyralis TaxID=7054 RepID=A0A5N4A980_PHOPY|nr:uncharacterized protein LOC116179367 [Photinus pyralis]KAB0793849.1 hypothetical protein PPYR_13469 [Photinus pyralis]